MLKLLTQKEINANQKGKLIPSISSKKKIHVRGKIPCYGIIFSGSFSLLWW